MRILYGRGDWRPGFRIESLCRESAPDRRARLVSQESERPVRLAACRRLSTYLDRSALLKRDWLKWLFATLSRLRGIWRQFRKPSPLRANSFIRTD
jgi:hypothetical protein